MRLSETAGREAFWDTLGPGMHRGRRNGAVNSMQTMSSARVPNRADNAPSVIPTARRIRASLVSIAEAR